MKKTRTTMQGGFTEAKPYGSLGMMPPLESTLPPPTIPQRKDKWDPSSPVTPEHVPQEKLSVPRTPVEEHVAQMWTSLAKHLRTFRSSQPGQRPGSISPAAQGGAGLTSTFTPWRIMGKPSAGAPGPLSD